MNASAVMRGRIVRGVGLLFLALVVVVWVGVSSQLTALPRRELSSVHLADPVEVQLGGETIRVTRFVLHPANRILILEQDELTFNDYGDATRVGGNAPRELWVNFGRKGFSDRFVITTSERLSPRPVLALEKNAENMARLYVTHRILDLRGSEVIPDGFGDRPQDDTFRFQTIVTHDTGLHGLGVSGSLSDGGFLGIDPNRYGSGTLLASIPAEVTFKPLGPGPLNRGRRAFELVSKEVADAEKDKRRFPRREVRLGEWILVLGPTELSEHRLLFKENGEVRQVLRLEHVDGARR